MRIRSFLVAVLLATGCASGGTQTASPSGDRNMLTQAQLVATNSGNLYDAIGKLRPEWLTTRGPTSVNDPTLTSASVYMNGQQMGRAEMLREVRPMDVTSVRFFTAGQASARFGMGHPRGVIELTRQ